MKSKRCAACLNGISCYFNFWSICPCILPDRGFKAKSYAAHINCILMIYIPCFLCVSHDTSYINTRNSEWQFGQMICHIFCCFTYLFIYLFWLKQKNANEKKGYNLNRADWMELPEINPCPTWKVFFPMSFMLYSPEVHYDVRKERISLRNILCLLISLLQNKNFNLLHLRIQLDLLFKHFS